jgi:hypothetical protein
VQPASRPGPRIDQRRVERPAVPVTSTVVGPSSSTVVVCQLLTMAWAAKASAEPSVHRSPIAPKVAI